MAARITSYSAKLRPIAIKSIRFIICRLARLNNVTLAVFLYIFESFSILAAPTLIRQFWSRLRVTHIA